MSWLQGRVFCLVTGASRGIGQEIVSLFSGRLEDGSTIVTVARDAERLEALASEITSKRNLPVIPIEADLCLPPDDIWSQVHAKLNLSDFDKFILVQNAGSIGDVSKKTSQFTDFNDVSPYWNLNLSSFIVLFSQFVKEVKSKNKNAKILVVNITSLCAIKGMPSFGLYSAGKAAREAFTRVAKEEHPEITFLDYAPGPVQTDMMMSISQYSADPGVRHWASGGGDAILSPLQTTAKLFSILESGFESGARIDYFD